MGFRSGSYAKVWGVEPKTETNTKVQLSVSKKNKSTGDYETEFSGFVLFLGSQCAKAAAALKEGDRIRLGDVDVTTFFSKEKNERFTTFRCFSFEGESDTAAPAQAQKSPDVDSGEVADSRLPF